MKQSEISDVIARAARKDRFLTEEERRVKGARILKRRALGLCGSESVKTLDEMAQLLYSTGVVPSLEEGRVITPSLVGRRVLLGENYYGYDYLAFDNVNNGDGQKAYKIRIYTQVVQ
ncbi:MAG: hypothetical protein Q8P81_01000 [Nanoarchaeota archaeon]|nr:hypothetical protein [Nanoarchaeota archaeon]